MFQGWESLSIIFVNSREKQRGWRGIMCDFFFQKKEEVSFGLHLRSSAYLLSIDR